MKISLLSFEELMDSSVLLSSRWQSCVQLGFPLLAMMMIGVYRVVYSVSMERIVKVTNVIIPLLWVTVIMLYINPPALCHTYPQL